MSDGKFINILEKIDVPITFEDEKIEGDKNTNGHQKAICAIVQANLPTEFTLYRAIIEILYIQGELHDKSFTCIFDSDSDRSKQKDYLKLIQDFPAAAEEHFADANGHDNGEILRILRDYRTVTVIDDLYFKDKLWLWSKSREIDENQGRTEERPENKWFIDEGSMEGDYSPTGKGEEINVEIINSVLSLYAENISEKCFNDCQWLNVLLVPIAFKGNSPENQEKLGMVFLHLGGIGKDGFTDDIFQRICRQIIVYWHYNISAEIIAEHRQAEERASGRAMLYDSIKGPVDELTALLNQAQKPLSDLTSVMSPMEQFIHSGPFLAPFFRSSQEVTLGEFGYEAPSLVSEVIKTHHMFYGDHIDDYETLIPAILLRALGETANARAPLWDSLRVFLIQPPPQKKALADGISKTLPILKEEWEKVKDKNTKDKELEKAFIQIKEWFNSSHKPDGLLPGSLLLLTAKIFEIKTTGRQIQELKIKGAYRPVDTIAAINSIHLEYGINGLKITRSKPLVRLELKLKNAHNMTQGDAEKLKDDTNVALKDARPPRGSTTSILHKLFYSPQRNGGGLELNAEEDNKFTLKMEKENGTGFSLTFLDTDKIRIITKFEMKLRDGIF